MIQVDFLLAAQCGLAFVFDLPVNLVRLQPARRADSVRSFRRGLAQVLAGDDNRYSCEQNKADDSGFNGFVLPRKGERVKTPSGYK